MIRHWGWRFSPSGKSIQLANDSLHAPRALDNVKKHWPDAKVTSFTSALTA